MKLLLELFYPAFIIYASFNESFYAGLTDDFRRAFKKSHLRSSKNLEKLLHNRSLQTPK